MNTDLERTNNEREIQAKFRPRAQLLIQLGDQLIKNESIALVELIKNAYEDFSIRLIAYKCKFISATFELTDHDRYEWVSANKLSEFELADADLPFLKLIQA